MHKDFDHIRSIPSQYLVIQVHRESVEARISLGQGQGLFPRFAVPKSECIGSLGSAVKGTSTSLDGSQAERHTGRLDRKKLLSSSCRRLPVANLLNRPTWRSKTQPLWTEETLTASSRRQIMGRRYQQPSPRQTQQRGMQLPCRLMGLQNRSAMSHDLPTLKSWAACR